MRIIGLAGWSGAGKTTLLKGVVPRLVARGVSVATVKHAHHAFEIDAPGKDSFEHRRSGAGQVLVASAGRYALIKEHGDAAEPGLGELLAKLDPCDLVLVEGFKAFGHPKVEVFRHANAKPPLFATAPNVRAMIADAPVPGWTGPVTALDDHDAAADLLLAFAEPLDAVRRALDLAGAPRRIALNAEAGDKPLRRIA